MIKIAFAGNPNVGKSALINAMGNAKLRVGNWPGVTVEKKEAEFIYKGEKIKFIDLPGVYSLSPYTMEEKITRSYILEENPDLVINVVDSTNLERNLYLTQLLKELGKPMIMALNFSDEFEKLKYSLDIPEFSRYIEMDVFLVSATRKEGITKMLERAIEKIKEGKETNYKLRFDTHIDEKLNELKCILEEKKEFKEVLKNYSKDFLGIKLLENDEYFMEVLREKYNIEGNLRVEEMRREIEEKHDNDIETIFAEFRYGTVNGILVKTLKTSMKSRLDFTEKVDKILLNKILGLPLFLFTIALLMGVVFNGAAPLQDYIDQFINGYIAKYVGILVEGAPNWLQSFFVNGLINGVGGIIVFVPLMFFLYFSLAILEESGYMSRVAFLMDRIMRKLGLNGKAFVPMVLGFGCTVPAIYATRTLEDEKSKRLTAFMAPLMSCGARLPVYGLFTAAFFGKEAGLIVMSLYLLGIVLAILIGFAMKNIPYFKTDDRALLIELPPYRIPTLKAVLSSAVNRTTSYLKKATTVILGVLILLWALTYFPNEGRVDQSYMAKFGRAVSPIMKPTGFGDRWEAVSAIPPSIAAKEVVVGYMAQVLTIEDQNTIDPATTFTQDTLMEGKLLLGALVDSAKAIVDIRTLTGLFTPPTKEELEEGNSGVVGAVSKLWEGEKYGKLKAYSFMVFILLVVPCIVALAAIRQELGTQFMLFVTIFLTFLPYIVSTLIFQVGRLLY